jgi:hypothetical protein
MIAMRVDPHSGAGAPGSACQERGLAEYTPRNNRDVYKKAVTGTLCINEDLHSVPETPVWDTSPLFFALDVRLNCGVEAYAISIEL